MLHFLGRKNLLSSAIDVKLYLGDGILNIPRDSPLKEWES